MNVIQYIGFRAEAKDKKGEVYDASFMVTLIQNAMNPHQIQIIVENAIKEFHKLHSNGKILEQMQKNRIVM